MMSMSRLPLVGSNVNGVVNETTMSKSFGPAAGPVNELDIVRGPVKTVALSAPTLLAKVVLSDSGCEELVERLISILDTVVENANPTAALGRKRSSRITIGPCGKSEPP